MPIASFALKGGLAEVGREIRDISKERSDRSYEAARTESDRRWQEYRDQVNYQREQNLLRLRNKLSIEAEEAGMPLRIREHKEKERISAQYREPPKPTYMTGPEGGTYALTGTTAERVRSPGEARRLPGPGLIQGVQVRGQTRVSETEPAEMGTLEQGPLVHKAFSGQLVGKPGKSESSVIKTADSSLFRRGAEAMIGSDPKFFNKDQRKQAHQLAERAARLYVNSGGKLTHAEALTQAADELGIPVNKQPPYVEAPTRAGKGDVLGLGL